MRLLVLGQPGRAGDGVLQVQMTHLVTHLGWARDESELSRSMSGASTGMIRG